MKKISSLVFVAIMLCGITLPLPGLFSCTNNPQTAASDSTEVADSLTTDTIDANTDAIVRSTIEDFYAEYVFGGTELTTHIVESFCTEKLKEKLAADYDYDGDGYASWDFRTEYQDGPSSESRITSIETISSTQYLVSYVDMGHTGRTLITVVVSEGTVQFDEVVRVKD